MPATTSNREATRATSSTKLACQFLETEIERMRKLLVLLLAGAGLTVLAAPTASAQRLELPAGPDRELVSRACQTCHDLSMVISAAGQTRDGWDKTIEEMITYGMRVEPNERIRMLDYLSSSLGPSSVPAPK
jgi:cytochrome c5